MKPEMNKNLYCLVPLYLEEVHRKVTYTVQFYGFTQAVQYSSVEKGVSYNVNIICNKCKNNSLQKN